LDDLMVMFAVYKEHNCMDFNSSSSPTKNSRHDVAPLRHILPIPMKPVYALTP